MISVLIATKERPKQVLQCLNSILNNSCDDFEILVLDQSISITTKNAVLSFNNPKITYIKIDGIGKSYALNRGVKKAKGDILAFTDDDCVVTKNWVDEIAFSLKKHPDVASVTGNTFPYNNIPLRVCPPTIFKKSSIFTKPEYHSHIGFGNNYAIRKSVLESIGLFKTWLGPGSISTNCEDGEMIIRILARGHTILHNPKMVVYHNKKLNKIALKKQSLSYICGEMACYGYYSLSGYTFARRVTKNNFIDSFYDLTRMAGDIVKRKIIYIDEWKYYGMKFIIRIKGLTIGLYYFIKEAM